MVHFYLTPFKNSLCTLHSLVSPLVVYLDLVLLYLGLTVPPSPLTDSIRRFHKGTLDAPPAIVSRVFQEFGQGIVNIQVRGVVRRLRRRRCDDGVVVRHL